MGVPPVREETDYGVLIEQEFNHLYHVAEQARKTQGLDQAAAKELAVKATQDALPMAVRLITKSAAVSNAIESAVAHSNLKRR